MSSAEYLGIVAGVFTTFAVVPQIIRVYKLKSAREISLIFTTSMLLGIVIWLVYGIVLGLLHYYLELHRHCFKRLAFIRQSEIWAGKKR